MSIYISLFRRFFFSEYSFQFFPLLSLKFHPTFSFTTAQTAQPLGKPFPTKTDSPCEANGNEKQTDSKGQGFARAYKPRVCRNPPIYENANWCRFMRKSWIITITKTQIHCIFMRKSWIIMNNHLVMIIWIHFVDNNNGYKQCLPLFRGKCVTFH